MITTNKRNGKNIGRSPEREATSDLQQIQAVSDSHSEQPHSDPQVPYHQTQNNQLALRGLPEGAGVTHHHNHYHITPALTQNNQEAMMGLPEGAGATHHHNHQMGSTGKQSQTSRNWKNNWLTILFVSNKEVTIFYYEEIPAGKYIEGGAIKQTRENSLSHRCCSPQWLWPQQN